MIDIHCHILPGMDDGASDISQSLKMIRLAKDNDIDVIVATSHFADYDDIDDFVEERNDNALSLNEIAQEYGIDVSIACGAEVFLDNKVFTAGNLDELTINSSRYMLCEYTLNPFEPEKAMIYAEEIISRGYVPIIAHPERYITFAREPEIVNELWDMGCKFQVNASTLAGHGGDDMQDFAKELVLRGFVDFIGTDAHSPNMRNNRLLDKIDEFPEEITREMIEYMTTTAPLKVIKNESLDKKEVEYF